MRVRSVVIGVMSAVMVLSTASVASAQTVYDHVVVVMFENTDRTAAMAQPNFAAFANVNSSDQWRSVGRQYLPDTTSSGRSRACPTT